MDVDTLRQAVDQAGFPALGLSFLAGLFLSINPVTIAAIPVSLAYVTRAREKRTALAFGSMFIAGLVATHIALGVAAVLGGLWVKEVLGRYWGAVLGPFLILLGRYGWDGSGFRCPPHRFAQSAQPVSGVRLCSACRFRWRCAQYVRQPWSCFWALSRASVRRYSAQAF
jgi:cytochrome c-type biogenesis protein